MAKSLPKPPGTVDPEMEFLCGPKEGYDEMLVAALEHPDRDVQAEAVRRMVIAMHPNYAEPFARWLLSQTSVGSGIFSRRFASLRY